MQRSNTIEDIAGTGKVGCLMKGFIRVEKIFELFIEGKISVCAVIVYFILLDTQLPIRYRQDYVLK